MPANILRYATAKHFGGSPIRQAIMERRRAEEAKAAVVVNIDLPALAENLYQSLSQPQKTVFTDTARFKYLMAGRRFGKTYLSLTRLVTWAMHKPNGLFYYVTATYRQAKQIAWVDLKRMVPTGAMVSKNEQELSIELINGARIYLKGAEDPDRLRGVSLSGCVIDEAAYVRQDAWTMVLRPALSDQQGPAWFITTPAGENWFTDALTAAETGDDPEGSGFRFTTADGGRVAASEIEAARRTLGEDLFSQEYGAEIVDLKGLAIFRKNWFVHYTTDELGMIPRQRIICSLDANFKEGAKTDFVGVTTWLCVGRKIYLVDIKNQRIGFVDTVRLIKTLWQKWRFTELLVEDKANGSAIIDQLKREASEYSIIACNPLGGKVARANAAAPSYSEGLIYHPLDDPLVKVLEQQLLALGVREDGNDDLADSVTQAVNYIAGTGPMTFGIVSYGYGTSQGTTDPRHLAVTGYSGTIIS